jgi:hypothetical protein
MGSNAPQVAAPHIVSGAGSRQPYGRIDIDWGVGL